MNCKSKIMPSEAQNYFERLFNERPVEPYNTSKDAEAWAEIAEWERKRAESLEDYCDLGCGVDGGTIRTVNRAV